MTAAILILAGIAIAAAYMVAADLSADRMNRRLAEAYNEGYDEGKAVAGREFNATQVRWSA